MVTRVSAGLICGMALALLVIVPAVLADAQVQPVLPQTFFGTIEAGGQPVPAGVLVEVSGEGIRSGVMGNPVFSHEGGYGSADPMAQRLEAQGAISPGSPLTFFVGGVRAEVHDVAGQGGWLSEYAYTPGSVTELNLRVVPEVTPAPKEVVASLAAAVQAAQAGQGQQPGAVSNGQPQAAGTAGQKAQGAGVPGVAPAGLNTMATLPAGGLKATPVVMAGLIVILAALGGIAYYFGKKEKQKKE